MHKLLLSTLHYTPKDVGVTMLHNLGGGVEVKRVFKKIADASPAWWCSKEDIGM